MVYLSIYTYLMEPLNTMSNLNKVVELQYCYLEKDFLVIF